MGKPRLIIFASGTKDAGPSPRQSGLRPREGGGSGFENLVQATRLRQGSGEATQKPELDAEIIAVVSNHEHGGVRERADRLGVPFIFFSPGADYKEIVEDTGAEWVALSGWLKMVRGLDPRKTFNIHPALLSQLDGRFGGHNMYGHRVHEAVAEALEKGEISESGLSMHFVTDEYDRGPVFFEFRVPLKKGMNADEIAKLVNVAEHEWQPKITNKVLHGEISWDGESSGSLRVR